MQDESCGVDVVVDLETIKAAPHCAHGPTLLFERYRKGLKTCKRFYACSASRDRSFCNFFRHADDKVLTRERNVELKPEDWLSFPYNHDDCEKRLEKMMQSPPIDRLLCRTCGHLLFRDEAKSHKGHNIQYSVLDDQLLHPTKLLQALTNNKTNAQYLFANETMEFLKDAVRQTGAKRVLCIGTPKVYEELMNDNGLSQNGLKCLLLDIDRRFEQFYNSEQFCRYNMFNHHFFNSASKDVYMHFVQDPSHSVDDLLVVVDPPFGGLIEVLALTMKRISLDISNDSSVEKLPNIFWFFPYFMEPKILECLPSFSMLDYKVTYDNCSKRAPDVRIFTNLEPSKVVLPASKGYKFCSTCNKYVAKENEHCSACNACTTKSGETYTHCDLCNRCVKNSWQHCFECERCEVPNQHVKQIKLQGCHICGKPDHKRKDCPSKVGVTEGRARKENNGGQKRKQRSRSASSGKPSKQKKSRK